MLAVEYTTPQPFRPSDSTLLGHLLRKLRALKTSVLHTGHSWRNGKEQEEQRRFYLPFVPLLPFSIPVSSTLCLYAVVVCLHATGLLVACSSSEFCAKQYLSHASRESANVFLLPIPHPLQPSHQLLCPLAPDSRDRPPEETRKRDKDHGTKGGRWHRGTSKTHTSQKNSLSVPRCLSLSLSLSLCLSLSLSLSLSIYI